MDDIDQFAMMVQFAIRFALTDTSKLNLSSEQWTEALNSVDKALESFSEDSQKIMYAVTYGFPYTDEVRDKFVWRLLELLKN